MAEFSNGLAAGIESFARSVSDGIKERSRQGQLAQSLRKTLSLVDPESKGRYDALGLADLQGEMEGFALQQTIKKFALQQDAQAAQSGYYKAQEAHLAAAEDDRKVRRAALERFNTALGNDVNETGEVSPEKILKYAAGAGVYPEDLDRMMQAQYHGAMSEKASGANGTDRRPTTVNLNGRSVVYSPSTGAFQVLPPDGVEGESVTVDGEVVPGMARFGSNSKPVRLPREPQPRRVPESLHSLMNELQGDIQMGNNILAAPDSQFAKDRRNPEEARARATRNINDARKRGQQAIDRYLATGDITEDMRDNLYGELGLKGSNKAAAGAGMGAQGLGGGLLKRGVYMPGKGIQWNQD